MISTHIVSIYQKLIHADIVKVVSLNAVSTLVRMLSGLISVKIIAMIIGPSGIALVGQLNNMVVLLLGLSNGGISGGITKYVAENKENPGVLRKMISTAFGMTIFCTLILSVLLIAFSSIISRYVLLNEDYWYVFVIFGFTLVLYSLNILVISILNGFKEFQKYVRVNIIGTIIGLIYSISLVSLFGLPGALVNAVTYQSIMLFVTIYMCRSYPWLRLSFLDKTFDKQILRNYLKFSSMFIFSLIIQPITQLLLRSYVISEISITEAGWWEGMNRISSMYLSVITTSISVYYLPRLSELSDKRKLRGEIFKTYKFIIPFMILATICVYTLRHVVIYLLFTPEFEPMEHFFIWQLMGDFFKILSWLLAYLMVAKAMAKVFIISELAFGLSHLPIGYLFIHWTGTIGLVQAYFLNYVLYTIVMLIVFRKLIFLPYYEKNERRNY